MSDEPAVHDQLDLRTAGFYLNAMRVLKEAEVPILVGGAYAIARYTDIVRHTKDFDLFVRHTDAERALKALGGAGYRTEMTFPHWLGKAFDEDAFVDVIFNSGNGLCPVDDGWFDHAVPAEVLGASVRLVPAEEMLWQKAFIMERERFDGADVNHLLRARGPSLDWPRLLARFGPHWRVLLAHLVLFGFVYPGEQDRIPAGVLRTLVGRLQEEIADPPGSNGKLCRGPFLSRMQYLMDTERWGYHDARLPPTGDMTNEQINHWTAAAFDH
jgi:hypothetical protein